MNIELTFGESKKIDFDLHQSVNTSLLFVLTGDNTMKILSFSNLNRSEGRFSIIFKDLNVGNYKYQVKHDGYKILDQGFVNVLPLEQPVKQITDISELSDTTGKLEMNSYMPSGW